MLLGRNCVNWCVQLIQGHLSERFRKTHIKLRYQVFDGVPLENLYASHLRQDFYDVGYELFADKSKLTSEFIQADTFDENSALVHSLADKVDINAASFFHLFS